MPKNLLSTGNGRMFAGHYCQVRSGLVHRARFGVRLTSDFFASSEGHPIQRGTIAYYGLAFSGAGLIRVTVQDHAAKPVYGPLLKPGK